MRTVVVYESMYGNTHEVAERIGDAARVHGEVAVVPVGGATVELLAGADLVIVGGPTHAHTMTSSTSRKGAVADAEKKGLHLDPDAEGIGLRDWFDGMVDAHGTRAAAFDTRIDAPAVLTGRASKGIAKRLERHGFHLEVEPESFLVDKDSHLLRGEADRAQAWAEKVVAAVVPTR